MKASTPVGYPLRDTRQRRCSVGALAQRLEELGVGAEVGLLQPAGRQDTAQTAGDGCVRSGAPVRGPTGPAGLLCGLHCLLECLRAGRMGRGRGAAPWAPGRCAAAPPSGPAWLWGRGPLFGSRVFADTNDLR